MLLKTYNMSTLSKNFEYKLKGANKAHAESWDKNVYVPTLEYL